jgi:hypothetical protein
VKPGKPLARRSRLTAKTRIERRTPLRNGGRSSTQAKPMRQQSAKKRAKRRTWEQFRQDVYSRSEGICDLCATWIPWDDYECHHRRLRSQGGLDEMANLVALHKFGCHDELHRCRPMARETGFIVHKPDDPAHTPVLRHGKTWSLPGETWTHVDPEELVA